MMAEITVDESLFSTCRDKVVVITGGANGIGAATVTRFYVSGAHVFFSDINTTAGLALQTSLSTSNPGNGMCHFTTVDVTDYHAQLGLFETAYKEFGRIDHAIYSAGVSENPGWIVGGEGGIEGLKTYPQPLMDVLNINLNGAIYFTRIALTYLKDPSSPSSKSTQKSLTLLSSAQAFQDGPGLCAYSASKTAMLGLLRSLRLLAPARINIICPWATDTGMIAPWAHLFRDNNIPLNSADDVARYVMQAALDEKCNGKAIYVGGGKGWDVEEGLGRCRGVWLGVENERGWELQEEVFGKLDWMESK